MRCRKARLYLPARCDGTLAEEKRLRLEEHLAGCPACRRESFYFAELVQAAGMMERQPARAPADFNLRLHARIANHEAEQRQKTERRSLLNPLTWPTMARRISYVCASAVLALGIGFVSMGNPFTDSQPSAAHAVSKLDVQADAFYRGEMARVGATSEELDSMLDAYLAGGVPSYKLVPVDDSSPVSKNYILQMEPGIDQLDPSSNPQYIMPVVSTQQVSAKASY